MGEGRGVVRVRRCCGGRGRGCYEGGRGDIVEGLEEMRGRRCCGGGGMLWMQGEGTL